MEGSVLVHCAGGRSRSAALLTAYLMTTRGWHYDYAVSVLKHARPVIQINKGFEQQVRAYGAHQCDVYAAHQAILRQRVRNLVDRKLGIAMGNLDQSQSTARRGSNGGVLPSDDEASDNDGGGGGPRSRVPPTPSVRRRADGGGSQRISALSSTSTSAGDDASSLPLGGGPEIHVAGAESSSLFPLDMSGSRRGSIEGAGTPSGRSVNRSLHRRGKTTGTPGT